MQNPQELVDDDDGSVTYTSENVWSDAHSAWTMIPSNPMTVETMQKLMRLIMSLLDETHYQSQRLLKTYITGTTEHR